MADKALSKNQHEYLRELGLSNHAIRLYEALLARKRMTACTAAGRHNQYASAQYRLFYRLEAYGLVRRINKRPLEFEAVQPDSALPASFALKEQQMKRLLHKTTAATAADTAQMRLIVGRQALYDEFAQLAPQAQHSMQIYTIGIAFSDKFVQIMSAATKRGVRVRMVAQQLKPSNYHVLHKWQGLGMQVRLRPSERGFHLMLFDENMAIVTFSNPDNTEDRISIVTDSTAIIKQFGGYFEMLWQSSREIDV